MNLIEAMKTGEEFREAGKSVIWKYRQNTLSRKPDGGYWFRDGNNFLNSLYDKEFELVEKKPDLSEKMDEDEVVQVYGLKIVTTFGLFGNFCRNCGYSQHCKCGLNDTPDNALVKIQSLKQDKAKLLKELDLAAILLKDTHYGEYQRFNKLVKDLGEE